MDLKGTHLLSLLPPDSKGLRAPFHDGAGKHWGCVPSEAEKMGTNALNCSCG